MSNKWQLVKRYGPVAFFVFGAMASAQTTPSGDDPFAAVTGIGATIATGVGVLIAAGVAVLAATIGGQAAYRYAKKFLKG